MARSSAPRLPAEVIGMVLEYLPLQCLSNLAGVSRDFYGAALGAGFYIHRTINCDASGQYTQQLNTFNDLLSYAAQKGLGVGLSLTIAERDSTNMEDSLRAVSNALPLLVFLSIQTRSHLGPDLCIALSYPAPRLRTLLLTCLNPEPGSTEPRSASQATARTALLASGIFSGIAPRLRHLALRDFDLGDKPLPAFAGADHLHLTFCAEFSKIPLARHFPRLHNLRLWFERDNRRFRFPAFVDRLVGMSLSTLILDNFNMHPSLRNVGRVVDLRALKELHYVGRVQAASDPIWLHDTVELNLRLVHGQPYPTRDRDVRLVVVPAHHRRWRRVIHVPMFWYAGAGFRLAGPPRVLSTRIVYLRLGRTILVEILRCPQVGEFPALRRIHVDVDDRIPGDAEEGIAAKPAADGLQLLPRKHGNGHSVYAQSLACPMLEELTLFALYEPAVITVSEVVLLGRAFRIPERPQDERPSLAAVGVTFVAREQEYCDSLSEVFSRVTTSDFAGAGSAEDCEGGQWIHWDENDS